MYNLATEFGALSSAARYEERKIKSNEGYFQNDIKPDQWNLEWIWSMSIKFKYWISSFNKTILPILQGSSTLFLIASYHD